MKVFMNTITKKILIALITIIMISNFIMPNYVHAGGIEDLTDGLFYLVAKLGDVAISTMQLIMVGSNTIETAGYYTIQYSPGMIFSGNVLALDVNFINPKTETKDRTATFLEKRKQVSSTNWTNGVTLEKSVQHVMLISNFEDETKIRELFNIGSSIKLEKVTVDSQCAWEWNNGNSRYRLTYLPMDGIGVLFQTKAIFLHKIDTLDSAVQTALNNAGYNNADNIILKEQKNNYYSWMTKDGDVYECEVNSGSLGTNITVYKQEGKSTINADLGQIKSPAKEMQNSIVSWYKALRTIALVGLLSVLVYLGIRIILSSTSAQDKAKYKSMLTNWLVAICLLFVLHYIMVFLLGVTSELNLIIKNNMEGSNAKVESYDKLLSKIRNDIGADLEETIKNDNVAGNAIMYLALVILTGIFTIQYLKRVVFMAFLTMIAPMIALTYPLDKVKDGKAQAFSYWLKEYILNCLIQPVHLLIYTIFISNAIAFAQSNMIYAIVALAFMVPAEKIIKEMFGMKSNSPTNTLGAAAGGALVMSMLQKIKGKPSKDQANEAGSGASNSTNGVRTANQNGGKAIEGAGKGVEAGGKAIEGAGKGVEAGGKAIKSGSAVPVVGPVLGAVGTGVEVAGKGVQVAGKGVQTAGKGVQTADKTTTRRNTLGGLNALGKRHIYGVNALKSHAGRLTGVAGAIAAGGIGLAAQIADGDLFDNTDKAVGQIAMATGIGYVGGKNLAQNTVTGIANMPQNIRNAWDNNVDTFDKGSLSAEEYQKRNAARQFFKSDDYKAITQDSSINQTNIRERTQQFLNNGITDPKVIREALQLNISADECKEYADAGVTAPKDVQVLAQNGIDTTKLKNIQLYSGDTGIDKIKSYSTIAQAAKTAGILGDNSTTDLNNFKLNFAAGHNLGDSEAEKLYKKLLHYWN